MEDIRTLFARSLAALLAALGRPADDTADAQALARRLLQAAGPGAPDAARARQLLCLQKDEARRLAEELEAFLQHDELPADGRGPMAARNAELAMLRVLLWFETARANHSTIDLPDGGPARPDHLQAFRLLSALELMMRELLRQQHGNVDATKARLEQLLPADAAGALKRKPDDPIAGLFLKDLIRLYVDAAEWERVDPIYRESAFLRLLRERRLTADRFLDDVRRIRNDVAHLKPLTAVQHELLTRYYQELVEPVRDAHRAGRTAVDPGQYEKDRTEDEFTDYRRGALDELARETRATGKLARLSLGLSALLLLLALPVLWPMLRVKLDPDLRYMETLQADPAQHGALAVQACMKGDLQALAHLAAQPGAPKAMIGPDRQNLHYLIISMVAREPARVLPCLPKLAAMGWDANAVGGNTVASVWGDGAAPDGYIGYLQAHAAGLAPGRPGTAAELRCPALVFAVWRADAALASALAAAGARADAPCIVDAIWLGGTQDGTLSSALDEARRMGKPELMRALGH